MPSSERHLRPIIAALKTDSERIAVWYQNGLLLIEIRDTGLYKAVKVCGENGHQQSKWTLFEDYVKDRWHFKKSRGYQLLDAASLTRKIEFLQTKSLTGKDEKSPPLVDILPESERLRVGTGTNIACLGACAMSQNLPFVQQNAFNFAIAKFHRTIYGNLYRFRYRKTKYISRCSIR